MKRIRVSADLEREIRENYSSSIAQTRKCFEKLVALLDEDEPKRTAGIGYSKIVEYLRDGLGQRLATPEKPHVSWIVRQVNRVKELGLDEQQLRALGRRAAQTYNNSRPVELEFLLRAAVRLLAPVVQGDDGKPQATKVYTGRGGDDD